MWSWKKINSGNMDFLILFDLTDLKNSMMHLRGCKRKKMHKIFSPKGEKIQTTKKKKIKPSILAELNATGQYPQRN